MFLVDTEIPGFPVGAAICTVHRYIDGGHPHVHREGELPCGWCEWSVHAVFAPFITAAVSP